MAYLDDRPVANEGADLPLASRIVPAPRPPKRPVTRERHGRVSVDNYMWLRDTESEDPEVLDHLRAENEYVDEVLGHTADLQEELFQEIKGRIKETDLSVPTYDRGHWYYTRTTEGAQYPVYCRLLAVGEIDPPDPDSDDVRQREEVLLDVNAEAEGCDYFAVGVFDLTADGNVLAWAADRDGSEKYQLRFRDLTGPNAGTDHEDVIEGVYYSSAWSTDGRYFFYTRPDAAMRPAEIWRHELGADQSSDVLIHREDDERFFCSIGLTKDEAWILLQLESKITDEVRLCPADDAKAGFEVIVPRREGIEGSVDHIGGTFYLLTNEGALDFRVLSAPAERAIGSANFDHWDELVAHRPGVRIEDVDIVAGRLILEERTEASTLLRVRDLTTGDEYDIDRPEEVSTLGAGSNPDPDWPQLRYSYTSMVTPATVIDLDLDTGERHVRKVQPVLGGYDPDDYVSRRLWSTAADGSRVPISLVHRRDRQAGGPALMYGYGSYEISIDPGFSPARLSLLDRGWAFAIAHVRGGGEMGRRWYDDGKLAVKVNSFDDFIACGRTLLAEGIAGEGKLAIRGGSAGGLLVGAALNRAPELWGAVVAEVPFVDALNTILDPSLPLTVTEWEEWGNPIDTEEIFAAMEGYTPYENIPARTLPPVLATAGLNDPRVGYWEPAKWVARLRDEATGGPFLLKTEMGAGHGGPSGRYDAWRDEAVVLAFLIDCLGPSGP